MTKSIICVLLLIPVCMLHSCAVDQRSPANKAASTDTSTVQNADTTLLRTQDPQRKLPLTRFTSSAIDSARRVYVSMEGAVYLGFDNQSVTFIFGLNRCDHSFPVINENERIKVLWSLDDFSCTYIIGLDRNFALSKHPRKGDVFAELTPRGDSVIFVNYLFKDFIQKHNEMGKKNEMQIDTLFPSVFNWANY